MRRALPVLAIALALLSGAVQGQNLVVNGGFETGDFTGWTADSEWEVLDLERIEGDYAASLATGEATPRYLVQTLSTTPGQLYLASAWFRNDVDPGGLNGLEVYWNSTLIGFWENMPSFDWWYGWAYVLGTGSDTLTFVGYNTTGRWWIDDVQVVEAAAIPELPTFAPLALFSLSGLAFLRRRLRP